MQRGITTSDGVPWLTAHGILSEYFHDRAAPIFEDMIEAVLVDRPQDVPLYMLQWLLQQDANRVTVLREQRWELLCRRDALRASVSVLGPKGSGRDGPAQLPLATRREVAQAVDQFNGSTCGDRATPALATPAKDGNALDMAAACRHEPRRAFALLVGCLVGEELLDSPALLEAGWPGLAQLLAKGLAACLFAWAYAACAKSAKSAKSARAPRGVLLATRPVFHVYALLANAVLLLQTSQILDQLAAGLGCVPALRPSGLVCGGPEQDAPVSLFLLLFFCALARKADVSKLQLLALACLAASCASWALCLGRPRWPSSRRPWTWDLPGPKLLAGTMLLPSLATEPQAVDLFRGAFCRAALASVAAFGLLGIVGTTESAWSNIFVQVVDSAGPRSFAGVSAAAFPAVRNLSLLPTLCILQQRNLQQWMPITSAATFGVLLPGILCLCMHFSNYVPDVLGFCSLKL